MGKKLHKKQGSIIKSHISRITDAIMKEQSSLGNASGNE